MAGRLFQRLWRDCKIAHVFLTRLPLRVEGTITPQQLIAAAWAYPLVGVSVALVAAAAYYLCHWLGLPPVLCAIAALAASIAFTGCFHEDGLADTADGFGGGWTAERKLEIMRDSRLGSYGGAALVLSIAARAAALAALPAHDVLPALLVAHGLSRALLPLPSFIVDTARLDGLAAEASRPKRRTAILALAIGTVIAVLCLGLLNGLVALALVLAVAWLMTRLARAQIGGYTGDVLGAIQQLAEILLLCFAVALFS